MFKSYPPNCLLILKDRIYCCWENSHIGQFHNFLKHSLKPTCNESCTDRHEDLYVDYFPLQIRRNNSYSYDKIW